MRVPDFGFWRTEIFSTMAWLILKKRDLGTTLGGVAGNWWCIPMGVAQWDSRDKIEDFAYEITWSSLFSVNCPLNKMAENTNTSGFVSSTNGMPTKRACHLVFFKTLTSCRPYCHLELNLNISCKSIHHLKIHHNET